LSAVGLSVLEEKDRIRELLASDCFHCDEAQFDRWLARERLSYWRPGIRPSAAIWPPSTSRSQPLT
jgi:hypothetical protein